MNIKNLSIGLGAALVCLFGAPLLLIFVMVAGAAPPVGANVGSPRDIPAGPVAASAEASGRIGSIVTGCVVPAPVLLAIGKVESNLASTPVIGPALNGSLPGTVVVRDTDGGSLDGDPVWDHPVGPMQILPSMWRRWGRDADGDGVAGPQNAADAALTAAVILCQPPADLTDPAALSAALHRYDNSDAYVAEVIAWANTYDDVRRKSRADARSAPHPGRSTTGQVKATPPRPVPGRSRQRPRAPAR